MKRTGLLAIAVIGWLLMDAASITADQARTVAQQFIARNAMHKASGRQGALKLVNTTTSARGEADYYVFNIGIDGGFLIVGGDDQAPAVWGYSEGGSFEANRLPDNVRWWLGEYQRQLQWLRNHPGSQPRKATNSGTSVAQLLTTKWDQRRPYNDDCPDIPDSQSAEDVYYGYNHAVTGCEATAVAQIMKYYEWPTTGVGQHSYNCNVGYGDGLSYSTTLSADFSSSVYDWGLMMDEYYCDEGKVFCRNGSEKYVVATQSQQDAVARLMSDLGIATNMRYSAENSSCYFQDIDLALKTYFRYSGSLHWLIRNDYHADWDAMLRKELDAGRPVLYAGFPQWGGHLFVLDGYRSDGYFHVNWGWGGWCDGYFLTTLLNPEEDEEGFNEDQWALVGIQPDYNSETMAVPGDVNGDQVIDIDDLNMVINHMVRKCTLTGRQFESADCHRDDVIDIDDLNFIINLMVRKGYSHATPMSLVVDLRNGGRVVFPLADNPQLTFEGDNLHAKSKYYDYYFGRNELLRLSYVTATTASKLPQTHHNAVGDNPNQNAIYIYRNDNDFNAHLNVDVQRIQFSAVGTDGQWYDNALVQEVWTPDSVFRTPVAAVDSVTFQAPAPVVKQGLFVITEEHLPYMTAATDSTLTFKSSTPTGLHPVKGQVVYSELETEWFTMGFAGRVTATKQSDSEVTYECEPVSPRDVYDRLVTVGKIEATGNGEQGAPRRIADDGVIHSPKITIDVGYENYIRVKGSAAMTIDYAFNFGWGGKDFANVTLTDELSLSLSTSIKKSLGKKKHEQMLPIPVGYIGNKVVGASVNVGLFFELTGSVEMGLTIPYKIKHIEEYKWSSDDFFHISYNKQSDGGWGNLGDALDDSECTFKIKGGAKFGPIVKASLMIWKPKFLSINAALKGGPEVNGSFEFDFNDPDGYHAYDLLAKDTKLSTGMYLGVDVTAQTWKTVYDVATIGTTLFPRDSYLFPRFTQPNFASLTNTNPVTWEAGLDPMSVYTVPSNNLWLPGKVGIGLYDSDGNEIGKRYYGNWYFGGTERDWSKNWLQYNLAEDITPGQTYTVRPLFKLLNLFEVKGSPESQLTAPARVHFASESINVPKGAEYGLPIQDGWGYFALTDNSKPSVVDAQVYDSGENHYLRLKALKEGVAELTVTDLRSQQTAKVTVNVLKSQLLVSTENVRMNEGEEVRVDVLGGSGNYIASCPDSGIATARMCTEFGITEGQGGWSFTNHYVLITGVKAGETTVTVTDTQSGKTATVAVTVADTETGLSLSSYDVKVIEGKSRSPRINDGSGYYTVKSMNTSIATAEANIYSGGRHYVKITGKAQGTTKVKVKDNETGLMATVNVEVCSAYGDTMYGSPYPEDGAVNVSRSGFNFSCDAPYEYGAVYQLQWSDKPDMSNILTTVNISNHVYAASPNLSVFQPSTTYYWRVLKYDWDLDDFLIMSPVWSFTTASDMN